ncbi:MAG: hypothetical protein ACI4P6_02165 [Candidatus Spyradosoma sp.]
MKKKMKARNLPAFPPERNFENGGDAAARGRSRIFNFSSRRRWFLMSFPILRSLNCRVFRARLFSRAPHERSAFRAPAAFSASRSRASPFPSPRPADAPGKRRQNQTIQKIQQQHVRQHPRRERRSAGGLA